MFLLLRILTISISKDIVSYKNQRKDNKYKYKTRCQVQDAPSSKQSSIETTKFTCVQCKFDMREEKPFEIKQLSSETKVITEEIEDLQKDISKLNKHDKNVHSEGSDSIRN